MICFSATEKKVRIADYLGIFCGELNGWTSADPQIVKMNVFDMWSANVSQKTNRHSDK